MEIPIKFQRHILIAYFLSIVFTFANFLLSHFITSSSLIHSRFILIINFHHMSNFFSPLAMDQDSDGLPDLSQFYESEPISGKRTRTIEHDSYSIPSQFLFKTIDIRSLEAGAFLNANHPFANIPPGESIRSFRSNQSPDLLYLTSVPVKDLLQSYQVPLDQIFIISNPTANNILSPSTTQSLWHAWSQSNIPPPSLEPTTLFKTPGSNHNSSSLTDSQSKPSTVSIDSQFFLSSHSSGKRTESLPTPTSWPSTDLIYDIKLKSQHSFGSPVPCEWLLIGNIHLDNEDTTVTDILFLCHTIGHTVPHSHILSSLRNPQHLFLLSSGYYLWLKVLPFHTSNMLGSRASCIIPEFIIAPPQLRTFENTALNKPALQHSLTPFEGLSMTVQSVPAISHWTLLGLLAYCPIQQATIIMLLQAIRDLCPDIHVLFLTEKMYRRDFRVSDSNPSLQNDSSTNAQMIKQVGGSHFRHGVFYLIGPPNYARTIRNRFHIRSEPSLIRIGGISLGAFESRQKLLQRPCPPPHLNSTLYSPVLRFLRQSLPRSDLLNTLLQQPFNVPLFHRVGIEVSYGPDPTDTLVIFTQHPHQRTQPLVLGSDTELFLDRDAATAFKKKVLLEYQKKKEKTRPPSNLEAPNIVLPYERNFFTFWVSSIKLAAQLFKSTKLEYKILPHIDDKIVSPYDPAVTHTIPISPTNHPLPFPTFSFHGPSPPTVEQQLMQASHDSVTPDQVPLDSSSIPYPPQVRFQHDFPTPPTAPSPIFAMTGHEPLQPQFSSQQSPHDPLLILQTQLMELQTREREREEAHRMELARVNQSLLHLTQLLSSLPAISQSPQPSSVDPTLKPPSPPPSDPA
jgi:hypothetical protein